MVQLTRRELLQAGAALAVAGPLKADFPQTIPKESTFSGLAWMNMGSDGLHLTPLEHAERIHRLAGRANFLPDEYSLGGVVAQLESAFAALLGKEAAVFMPTGTLANHLAVRALAAEHRGPGVRVLVQGTSHLYNDTGDCVTTLSGLNLVPLGRDAATFTLAEVEAEFARSASGRAATQPGVLVIESPVRRRSGERFDPEELARITSFARSKGMGLHLDGARMLIAAAYTGVAPAVTAAPFDTVYVSLYKGLNAPSGAILAGPKKLLEGLYHQRRMFGGGLPEVWPFAASALEDLPGFGERMKAAVSVSEQVFSALDRMGIPVRRVPRGTNVAFLPLGHADPSQLQKHLAERRVRIGTVPAGAKELRVLVNESWSRREPLELAQALAQVLRS
jgi:threonine aldolase